MGVLFYEMVNESAVGSCASPQTANTSSRRRSCHSGWVVGEGRGFSNLSEGERGREGFHRGEVEHGFVQEMYGAC